LKQSDGLSEARGLGVATGLSKIKPFPRFIPKPKPLPQMTQEVGGVKVDAKVDIDRKLNDLKKKVL